MAVTSCAIQRALFRGAQCGASALFLAFALGLSLPSLRVDAAEPLRASDGSPVLTSFEQIWQLPEAEQHERHPVRFEYTVYYYDPLWAAMWGRCGELDSYLSLGTKVFPIEAGQRILVEGFIQPSRGMRIDEPRVTVLAEADPIEVMSTRGQIARTEQFNKRVVTVEGYVDRQVMRDANHVELYTVVEGRMVFGQLLLKNDGAVPQLKGKLVQAKGVYFARSEPDAVSPRIELWIQRTEDVTELGSLDTDSRFEIPATSLAGLASAPAAQLVRVVGKLIDQEPGKTLTLRDEAGHLVIQTPQLLPAARGDEVEAIGWPSLEQGLWVVREGLARPATRLLTSVAEIWALPESEHQKRHRVRAEILVYYYDPYWKTLWGRSGGSDDYISLAPESFPIRTGDQIRVEGFVRRANNAVIEQAKVTMLPSSQPLEPLQTQGRIGDVNRFNKQWVSVEGYVDRQVRTDVHHVELDLLCENRIVIARLLLPEGGEVPKWEGALLRMHGVYSATHDPTGGLPTLELWVPGTEHTATIGSLDKDERFSRPATAIEQLTGVAGDAPVRVVGTVRAQQPGKQLTLRDDTGQVVLRTRQARIVHTGQLVEAIGYPHVDGAQFTLRDAVFRPAESTPTAPVDGLPKLRLADQIRDLQPEEAGRGYPVQLSGVVTWARPDSDLLYVLDATGGVCVSRPPDFGGLLYAGSRIELTGVSATGRYTPVVLASSLQVSGSLELPEPRTVTLEQALTGIEDAQWVSMSGLVRAVVPDGRGSRFELTTSGGEFHAVLLSPPPRWAKLVGAVVRIRGVCTAMTNARRQLTGIQVWVPMGRFVEVEEPAPEDPFAARTRSIASLRQFNSLPSLNRRVRVTGTVTHQKPGHLIHIQDETEGLLVLSRDTTPLAPGDRIEVVGFPGRENSRVVLREAVYRRQTSGREPSPVDLRTLSPIDVELDARLVRVQGELLEVGTHEKGVRLIVENGVTIFDALLESDRSGAAGEWKLHSHVALTGVYDIQFDEYRRPQAVRLQLRSAGDVAILQRPPWWTARRALGAVGALAVLAGLGFGWVIVLRRRVHRQTGLIREQVESERAARLEAALARASKLESVGVLAGGIAHDFNNLLTVVMGNLSLAKLDPRIDPETLQCLAESERAATRARDLTQQLLTFSKGGEPMRAPMRLPDLIREAAEFALHSSKVRCEFEIAPDLWLASADKGQLGQVVHNLVINASQAMQGGGRIQIVMRNEAWSEPRAGLGAGRYVRLDFTDTGAGIAPENLSRIFEPYFSTKPQGSGLGLATVYSIIRKHNGHIEVKSTPSEGTTFTVWLPASAEAAAAPAQPAPTPIPASSARVLVMDDEAPIRMLAAAVLKRIGCEVTSVGDGAAAVREYAAASAAGRPFDLVILDLTVPGGIGGAEAMVQLQKMDPKVRAIVSSGYSSDPVMANFEAYGFKARVPKPYQASDLMGAVKRLLNRAG